MTASVRLADGTIFESNLPTPRWAKAMRKIFGMKVIENSYLPEGWIIALGKDEAVAAHPNHKPIRFDYSKPELGWQVIGED